MIKIIGVLGNAQHGKDEVSNYLIEKYGYVKCGFADPLKRGLMEMFDFSSEQMWGSQKEVLDPRWGVTPREVMKIFGTEVFQFDVPKYFTTLSDIGRAFWVKRFKIWYDEQPEDTLIAINDVRFAHEIAAIRNLGGQIWKIYRPGYDVTPDEHKSENELKTLSFDKFILNDTTLDNIYNQIEQHINL